MWRGAAPNGTLELLGWQSYTEAFKLFHVFLRCDDGRDSLNTIKSVAWIEYLVTFNQLKIQLIPHTFKTLCQNSSSNMFWEITLLKLFDVAKKYDDILKNNQIENSHPYLEVLNIYN